METMGGFSIELACKVDEQGLFSGSAVGVKVNDVSWQRILSLELVHRTIVTFTYK
jgi:hypothetical protein